MQFIHSCVIEKHELDETLPFLQCLVLCLREKLSFPHQCIENFLAFYITCGES